MNNPLIPEILELLNQNPHGMSEYAMMQRLGDHVAFSHIGDKGQLPLFQKHFLIMNGLYQLQQTLWEGEQLVLVISPLRIFLTTSESVGNQTPPAILACTHLRHYYLDWRNLEEMIEEDVLELYQLFWERFNGQETKVDALSVLGLNNNATAEMIQIRYRKLAAKHHPDRGGNRERFIEIRKAYESLK